MYKTKLNYYTDILSHIKDNKLMEPHDIKGLKSRILLKHGMLVDPMNGIEDVMDIAVTEGRISEVAYDIPAETGDVIIECDGLLVVPGLLDMHLHLGDLFEVTTNPIFCAAEDGVTTGLSPGAGNTFMAPALLGAELDRGLPINIGVFLGAANVLGTQLEVDELVNLFTGRLDEETASKKLTRNSITNTTAALIMGIKDHMGHFIMSDENIDKIFDITSRSGLIYMSHTQDPEHTERMVALSKGRSLHLAHATASGCGTHWPAEEGLERVLSFCRLEHITGEFVTTMLRRGGGSREGLRMTKQAQQLAHDALEKGLVDILVSDGQNQSTMKGFGDTRDNIPAILELAEMGILPLKDAVATMTCNPVRLIAQRTKNNWWPKNIGHLGIGAMANITVIDKYRKLAAYTIVNGRIVSFENRIVRSNIGSGYWTTKFGMVKSTGIGDIPMFTHV
jgi:hypothetical protein